MVVVLPGSGPTEPVAAIEAHKQIAGWLPHEIHSVAVDRLDRWRLLIPPVAAEPKAPPRAARVRQLNDQVGKARRHDQPATAPVARPRTHCCHFFVEKCLSDPWIHRRPLPG